MNTSKSTAQVSAEAKKRFDLLRTWIVKSFPNTPIKKEWIARSVTGDYAFVCYVLEFSRYCYKISAHWPDTNDKKHTYLTGYLHSKDGRSMNDLVDGPFSKKMWDSIAAEIRGIEEAEQKGVS